MFVGGQGSSLTGVLTCWGSGIRLGRVLFVGCAWQKIKLEEIGSSTLCVLPRTCCVSYAWSAQQGTAALPAWLRRVAGLMHPAHACAPAMLLLKPALSAPDAGKASWRARTRGRHRAPANAHIPPCIYAYTHTYGMSFCCIGSTCRALLPHGCDQVGPCGK